MSYKREIKHYLWLIEDERADNTNTNEISSEVSLWLTACVVMLRYHSKYCSFFMYGFSIPLYYHTQSCSISYIRRISTRYISAKDRFTIYNVIGVSQFTETICHISISLQYDAKKRIVTDFVLNLYDNLNGVRSLKFRHTAIIVALPLRHGI